MTWFCKSPSRGKKKLICFSNSCQWFYLNLNFFWKSNVGTHFHLNSLSWNLKMSTCKVSICHHHGDWLKPLNPKPVVLVYNSLYIGLPHSSRSIDYKFCPGCCKFIHLDEWDALLVSHWQEMLDCRVQTKSHCVWNRRAAGFLALLYWLGVQRRPKKVILSILSRTCFRRGLNKVTISKAQSEWTGSDPGGSVKGKYLLSIRPACKVRRVIHTISLNSSVQNNFCFC
jgi:hypothetical protein